MDVHEDYQPTHADIRSCSQPYTRHAKQSQKYYGFRSGPMSRIGQPILSLPDSLISPPWAFLVDPLLSHAELVRVRPWTKQDQFMERKSNIWPLDRKDHKFGRRKRGRGCDYVPPRWKMERSMKGRTRLVEGVELEMEEKGAKDAAISLGNGRFVHDCEEEAGILLDDRVHITPKIEPIDDPSDVDFDMLSDLHSEADESDWDIVFLH